MTERATESQLVALGTAYFQRVDFWVFLSGVVAVIADRWPVSVIFLVVLTLRVVGARRL